MIKKFIEPNLGHVSYIVYDKKTKESVIIDPKRDIDEYIKFIKKRKLNLKYIINTHPHADFVSGHLELKNKYPYSQIILHKDSPAKYSFFKAEEKDSFTIGDLKLIILETPGHTPYCISILVNEDNINKYIFTGDFLFIGDMGRVDLLGEKNKKQLLNLSYLSAKKVWGLDDFIIVFPSHFKGSLCGKNLKDQYFSTIGIEKKTNKSFLLCNKSKKEYIDNLASQSIQTPAFFKKMSKINLDGPELIEKLKIKKLKFKNDGIIIDVRKPKKYKKGFFNKSINIYKKANISLIAGTLIDISTKIYLYGSKNYDNVIKKLRRVGFDDINILDTHNLSFKKFKHSKLPVKIIDLEAKNGDINVNISDIVNLKLDKRHKYKVKCKNGFKSMSVLSYLYLKGYKVEI